MSRNRNLLLASLVAASFALPAFAGRPFITPDKRFPSIPEKKEPAASVSTNEATARTTLNGYEYVGGDTGWQLAPHRLVWAAGGFKHASDCPAGAKVAAAGARTGG